MHTSYLVSTFMQLFIVVQAITFVSIKKQATVSKYKTTDVSTSGALRVNEVSKRKPCLHSLLVFVTIINKPQ